VEATAAQVLLDGFTRVHDAIHRALPDCTDDELYKEPHPPIGWLTWRWNRVVDSNISRLNGQEQLWVADGWHAKFGMAPEPADFGRGLAHTRVQVLAFRADIDLLLAYHDAVFERTSAYLANVTAAELGRELDEPQYTPLPTVAVRVMSVLENAMNNMGQIGYLKAYHRVGGWYPSEMTSPTR
jgi:hypothetical protein